MLDNIIKNISLSKEPLVTLPFCIPTSNKTKFLIAHILSGIWHCQCFDAGDSNKPLVVALYFHLQLLTYYLCIFSYEISQTVISCSVQALSDYNWLDSFCYYYSEVSIIIIILSS